MNKKAKWAIPFAVLALTCGIAAGCGVGHEHSYTQWGSNETQHWKECPDDHERDEGTVANHGTPDAEGKCPDCGYQLAEPHTHAYTQWGSSLTQHWKECPDDGAIDNATKAAHGTPDAEGKCPDCGYQIVTYVEQQCKLVLRKDGANTALSSLDGISVTLSKSGNPLVENTDYRIEKGTDNTLTIKGIVSGTYTVTILTADGEYRYADTIKLDGSAAKELVLQYNYAVASAQAYYVDLTHMNDANRLLAINTSGVDAFWQWNAPVAEITLNLADEIKNSKNVKLEFHLQAEKPSNNPNNAFGVVMTETYKGVAMSIWDTENENDGVKLYNIVGQKLAWDAYSADGEATLKWLETAIYGENGVDIRVVRANDTLTYFAKDANGKWVALRSIACPADDATEIKFMGAGSDFTITDIIVDDGYTQAVKSYSSTLTVLDAQGEKVALAEGAKGLLIAGDTKYEVALTQNDDGTYAFSGSFVPGLYSFSILGKVNGYSSAAVQIGDESTTEITLQYGDYATATQHSGDGIQLADRVTISDGKIDIEGYHENGFWQWKTGGQSSNVVPAATLNLSDEIKSSRKVVLDFKLKATHSNNQPNNAFGIAMTEYHNGAIMSFWNVDGEDNETNGIGLYDLKGTWLGEDGWSDDKEGTLKWLETAIYGSGAYFRIERDGSNIKFFARNGNAWEKIFETECYEYAETMIKFLGVGSDFEISGIRVRVPKEGEVSEFGVNASFADDSAHGYKLSVDPSVEEGGSATLVIETDNANAAWSWFPNAITVNGTAVDFSTVQVESLGANRVRYTLTIDNVLEDINIVVTVAKGTKVDYNASVNDAAMGSLVCDMENYGKEYYWNDACGLTLTANKGYRLKSIVLGEGDGAVTVTEGWTKSGLVYSYTFTVTGDVKVNAVFEEIPSVDLANVTIGVTDKSGAAVTLADGEKLVLSGDYAYEIALTSKGDGTYSATGNVYEGTYTWYLSETKLGYVSSTLEVDADTNAITLQLGDIATATKYHHGDHQGMGECDFETLIAVENETVKINTANANGKQVDAFWCWNSPVPEAVLNISDEVKNATTVMLEFNLKAANSNESPNNAFGIVMAEGYKGVNMSIWSKNEQLAYYALTGNVLGNDAYGADKNTHDAWLKTAMYGANGVNIRVVRNGASLKFYAQNADGEWIKFFETTCDENAKTDIKFLGMGSDYTVSNISLTTTLEASTEVNVDMTVTITDGTDKLDLGESVAAVLSGATDYNVTLTKQADGTYRLNGVYLSGEYKLVLADRNVGFPAVEVVVGGSATDIQIQYALATVREENINYDDNGMPYTDLKDLVTVTDEIAIDTAKIGDSKTAGFYRWNSSVPEATLNVSEEIKNATNVMLEFNLKVANGNNDPNNAFGIAMAEGYKGVAISLWNINDNKIDLHELTGCKLGADGWGYADTYASFGWIETLAESATGVNIRVVREGAKITFYAQNTAISEGEQWVKFFETTCDENAKTDIKFLGMGSDYTISNISVTVNAGDEGNQA